MTHIRDELYLGGRDDAFSRSFMTEKKTAVLNVAYDVKKSPYCIDYLHIPLQDTNDERIIPHFERAISFINYNLQKGYRVLIHCAAGISRSASFAIAYIMFKYRMKYADAHEEVKKKRSMIDPNYNFCFQLYAYEQQLNQ